MSETRTGHFIQDTMADISKTGKPFIVLFLSYFHGYQKSHTVENKQQTKQSPHPSHAAHLPELDVGWPFE